MGLQLHHILTGEGVGAGEIKANTLVEDVPVSAGEAAYVEAGFSAAWLTVVVGLAVAAYTAIEDNTESLAAQAAGDILNEVGQ